MLDDPMEPCSWEQDTASDGLSVSRSDITFANITEEEVAIEVRVTNPSVWPSAATRMVLQAAPMGAFVPWQPLATLDVPALRGGETRTVRTLVRALQLRPLGDPARVPPKKLLTALGLADEPPRRPRRKKRTADPLADMGSLPADPMQLLRPGQTHWIGNINVHIGKVAVERHLARALRVVPGHVNVAWFMVGSRRRDAYAFHLNDQGRDWHATLHDTTSHKTLIVNVAEAAPLEPNQWITGGGTRMMMLYLRPPRGCKAGSIEVHVTQRSTGREAVVEFLLDPKAAGPGCYVV
jgi:hypothetical protein